MPLSIGQGSGKPNRQLIETDTLQTVNRNGHFANMAKF